MESTYRKQKSLVLIILAILFFAGTCSAASIIVGNGIVTSTGQNALINITLDSAPTGLSGYNITAVVTNQSVAQITSITFPGWAAVFNSNGTLPASSCWIKALNTGQVIVNGSTNITFATLSIQGLQTGTTNVTLQIKEIDDSIGNPITPSIQDGIFTVSGVVPPASITNLHNTTYLPTSITWNWTDPSSPDFDHVMVYLNGVFQINVTPGIQSFTASNLSSSTPYTIGTQTVGTTGLINQTWVNNIASTAPMPSVPPVANFTSTPDHGFIPLHVFFNDTSVTGPFSVMQWTFGIDQYSSQGNPSPDFTYYQPGTYIVNHTVTNSSGTSSVSHSINVTNQPVANFTVNQTNGPVTLNVQFTDLSKYATSWLWTFGDGSNSTQQNTTHNYTAVGVYDVTLRVFNVGGEGIPMIKTGYITVKNPCPVANFTVNKTSGDIPLTVQFTDQSTGTITTRNWDFGDSSPISHDTNPVHTYVTPNVYTVRLEVLNQDCSNESMKQNLITATQPRPVADFTGGPASGIAKLTEFNFTDLSTNNPTSWHWNFGDGTPWFNTTDPSVKNPHHIYNLSNNYYVTLMVSNAGGSDSITRGPIPVRNPQAAPNFTATPRLGSVPMTVQFNDTSSNIPNTWVWDFGDNTFARGNPNPVHTYNKAGSYTVTLAVNDTTSGQQPYPPLTRPAYITVTNTPFAGFTADPTSGTVPLFVRFTDQSQGNPIRFYWKFGDGTFSSTKNPTHSYGRPGVYTVTETVQNLAGFNTTVKQDLITVTDLPQAGFFVNATSGIAPTTIRFTDTSTATPSVSSWSWDFGDGSPVSTEQNPVHTYYSSGVYSVQLIVSNGVKTSTVTKPSLITIGTPSGADFTFKPVKGDVPLMIQFTDNSAGNPIIYKWQFGDGYTSKDQNPIHTYTKPGNYTVTLTITTNTGATSSTSKVLVLTGTPVTSFKANPTGGSSPLTVQFTDTSSNNPTTWFWTYGDGTFGNVQNPVHTYNIPGTYTVKLFASNSYGGDEVSYPGLISVSQFS